MNQDLKRCAWLLDDKLMLAYHDKEWGVPVHRDIKHFEFLILDAFQAGLSWRTVLHKRANFRKAFANFNPKLVSRFNGSRIKKLLQDSGIIRNRLVPPREWFNGYFPKCIFWKMAEFLFLI